MSIKRTLAFALALVMCFSLVTPGVAFAENEQHEHTWDEGVVTAPTCTAQGYTTYTCSECGESYTADETEALNHDFSVFVKTVAATAEAKGYTLYKCSRCEETEERDFTSYVAPTQDETPAETAVASVNGVEYADIAEAVEAALAGEGSVLVLLANIESEIVLQPGDSLMVKAGDYAITVKDADGNVLIAEATEVEGVVVYTAPVKRSLNLDRNALTLDSTAEVQTVQNDDPEAKFYPTESGDEGWSEGTLKEALAYPYDFESLGEDEAVSIQLYKDITLSENLTIAGNGGDEVTYTISSGVMNWVEDTNTGSNTGTSATVTIDPDGHKILIPVGVSVWLEDVTVVGGNPLALFSAPDGYSVKKAEFAEYFYLISDAAYEPDLTHIWWMEVGTEATSEQLSTTPDAIKVQLYLDAEPEDLFFGVMESALDPDETVKEALDSLWLMLVEWFDDPHELADDISVLVVDVQIDGAWTIGDPDPVAQIGETTYASLADALKAAQSGSTIEILNGTWGADAIGSLTTQEALDVRYKSLTIQPAEGASVTFTSDVKLGYDDSSTANATMTVTGINFSGATLRLGNYVQATVENCNFSGSNANGALVIIDSCCTNHKSTGEYLDSQVTVRNCTFNGSASGAPAIRLRDSGSVTLTGNTVTNASHNGILFESNTSLNNTPAKTISITGNTITEWNSGNATEGGRAMRLSLGTLASGSTVTISGNYFIKATVGLDAPDFVKITGAGAATVNLSHNYWNNQTLDTVKNNGAYYSSDATSTTINSVICNVAQIGDVKYETLAAAIAAVPTDGTLTTIKMIANEAVDVTTAPLTISVTKNVVLDLNGFEVAGVCSSGKSSALITNRGTLTIKDSSDTNADGTGTGKLTAGATPTWIYDGGNDFSGSYASNLISNLGTLTVQSGFLMNNASGSACYAVDNNSNDVKATLNVEGGKLSAVRTVVRMFCNSTTKENRVNISGGEIVSLSGSTAMWTQLPGSNGQAKIAYLTITGGSISAAKYAWYDYSFGDVYNAVSYSFSGGSFKGIVEAEQLTGFISGGIYSVAPADSLIATGYSVVPNTDPATSAAYPYKVTNVTYETSTTDLQPVGETSDTQATYRATTTVKEIVNGSVQSSTLITNQEIAVSVNQTNDVAATTLSDMKLGEVVSAVLEAAGTEANKVTAIQVYVESQELVVDTENKSVSFEVDPKAIVTVTENDTNNTFTMDLTNADLSDNASFTFSLYVTDAGFAAGSSVKVTHVSDDSTIPDEVFMATVQAGENNTLFVEITTSHFSTFTLSQITPDIGKVAVNLDTGVQYNTLEAAINAAQSGDTIALLAEVTLTERLFVNAGANPAYAGTNNRYATTSENKSITLDLNGHNITSSSNIALAGGSLNITGSGTIETTGSGLAPIEVRGTGDLTSKRTLTIGSGVTLNSASSYGLNVFGSNDAQENVIDVTVDGTVNGTLFVLGNLTNAANAINIVVNGTVNAPVSASGTPNVGIALNGNANVTVNNGATVSGDSGIEVRAGTLTVNGGTISGTGVYSASSNGSGSSTRGAGIAIVQHTTKLPIHATLNGGTVSADDPTKAITVDAVEEGTNMAVVQVQAMQSFIEAQTVVPEGYGWFETSTSGVYEIAQAVAMIGTTPYATLAAAVAAAQDGDTIKLLTDLNIVGNNLEVALGSKSVSLDLSGHTLTGRINLRNGTLEVKNGNLAHTVDGQRAIDVYGTDNSSYSGEVYTKLIVDEDVTISGGSYGIVVAGKSLTDNYAYGVVVEMNGKINNTNDGIFVMGNIGNTTASGEAMKASGASPKISVTGSINTNNLGIQMSGASEVTVSGSVTAPTAIGVKRGTLNVVDGAYIQATGAKVDPAEANLSGTEATGAAISVTPTYNDFGGISVNVSGGTITSNNNAALYVGHSTNHYYKQGAELAVTGGAFISHDTDAVAVYIAGKETGDTAEMPSKFVSGGDFSSIVPDDYCAQGYKPVTVADEQTGLYTVQPAADGSAKLTWSLLLSDSITVRFKLKNLKVGEENATAEQLQNFSFSYAFNGGEATVVHPTAQDTNLFEVARCYAMQMTDKVHIVVKYYNTVLVDKDYTIHDYCEQYLATFPNGNEASLCKAILDYGTAAQQTFNYKADNLANGGTYFTEPDMINIPESYNVKDGGCNGITGVTYSLVTDAFTQFNIRFKHSPGVPLNNYTIIVKIGDTVLSTEPLADGKYAGVYYTLTDVNNGYKICVIGIPARYLGETIVATIFDGSSTFSFTSSPINYLYAMLSTDQANLAKAMYNYYLAAKSVQT